MEFYSIVCLFVNVIITYILINIYNYI
ncbi:hypothetical protein, partial [Plasmodium yoelii yoelii]